MTTVPVFVGHDAKNSLKLSIEGLGERVGDDSWLFKNKSESIPVQRLGLNLFIQTDRPIYKPGQTSK